jgi:hypothetical protein
LKKIICANYFNSLKQDPALDPQKIKQGLIYAICTKSGNFGVFFFKTKLKPKSIWAPYEKEYVFFDFIFLLDS